MNFKKSCLAAFLSVAVLFFSGCEKSSSGNLVVTGAPIEVRDLLGNLHYLTTGKLKIAVKEDGTQLEIKAGKDKFRIQLNEKFASWDFELKGADVGQNFDIKSSVGYTKIGEGRRYNSSSGTKSFCRQTEDEDCSCSYRWLEDYTKYRKTSVITFIRHGDVAGTYTASLGTEENTSTISGSETDNCGI